MAAAAPVDADVGDQRGVRRGTPCDTSGRTVHGGVAAGPATRGAAKVGGVRESLRESRDALREVFRNRGLRRLNLALAGSVVGDWAYATAASVYAYGQGGATAVGALGVSRYLLSSLVLPFTSTLADRYDRKRVMAVTDGTRIVLVVAGAAVIQTGGPALAVYVLAVVTSLVGTAFRPAQGALLPKLATSPGELTATNVTSSTIDGVGFFVGPAIAGLMLAWTDVAAVYAFDAVTFLWSAVLVLGVPVPDEHRGGASDDADADDTAATDADAAAPSRPGILAGVGAGYTTILRDRDLRLVIGLYCGQTVVAGASVVFTVAVALDLLDLGDSGVGLLDSFMGVGGIVGGLVALVLAQRGRLARDFGIGVVLWASPLLLIAASPTLGAAISAMALIGLANSIVDVNASTILQRIVPDAVMGRVFGAMDSAVIAGMALGSLLMPVLMATVGLRWGLTIIGGGVTLAVVAGFSGLRRIDAVVLAPEGLELIRGVPIFTALPPSVLERLARRSHVVSVASGDVVFREGDEGDRYYVIASGTAEVTIRGQHVRDLGPGDTFGEIALLRDIPRTATVTATSAVTARTIERDEFIAAVTGHGEAAERADAVVGRLMAIT
jgi:MFS family permease